MKNMFVMLILSGVLAEAGAIAQAPAQDHRHEQSKEIKEAPAKKATDPAKADSIKCCDMDKMGEIKQGTPMKADMKIKMEKMKEMKEKMVEKMKAKATESTTEKPEKTTNEPTKPEKDAHQH